MRTIFTMSVFLIAFSMHAERSPLSPEQLQREADQICSGYVSDIQSNRTCLNRSCTNYEISSIARIDTTSCEKNSAPLVYARFFEYVYNEGFPPVGASAHYPQPEIGQIGTVYLKNGHIVYPNGWVPAQ